MTMRIIATFADLRVGDVVDFGLEAVPPRFWRVATIELGLEGATVRVRWVPLGHWENNGSWLREGVYPSSWPAMKVPETVLRRGTAAA